MRAFRHPMLMRDLVGIGNDNSPNNALLALLMLAGFARKEMPWLSELLREFYREFKVAQDSGERIELVTLLNCKAACDKLGLMIGCHDPR